MPLIIRIWMMWQILLLILKIVRLLVGLPSAIINATGPASSNLGVDFEDNPVSCPGVTTTWNGTSWDNNVPTLDDMAIIAGDFDTDTDGNIDACTCEVQATRTLTINDMGNLVVVNDITVDGSLIVEHGGSVVQIDDSATVINNGTIEVQKNNTFLKPQGLYPPE